MLSMFHTPWGETYKNVEVQFGHHGDGSLAIRLVLENGEVLSNVTMVVEGYKAPEGYVVVKDYSEGEGMAEALEVAEVLHPAMTTLEFGPFRATAKVAKVMA